MRQQVEDQGQALPDLQSRTPPDFDALYEAHIREIYAYCLRRTSAPEAQDAAAEVFAVVWRRRGELPVLEETLPWIYGVARNVLANRNRSIRRRARLEARLIGLRPIGEYGPEAGVERLSEQEEVLTALARLPERDRETIRLIEWEGLSRQQVADLFGVSRAAIDQRLNRAYKRLGRILSSGRPVNDGRVGREAG